MMIRTTRLWVAICALLAMSGCAQKDGGGGGDTDTGAFDPPGWCAPPESGRQEVRDTPASPYFVDHPAGSEINVPTVVFLPGGNGGYAHANGTWLAFFDGVPEMGEYRVVMPYSSSDSFPDESDRIFDVLDEVFVCYGGMADSVHLAGHSNGGYAAFDLMLESPDRFATLLGAPGLFSNFSSGVITDALLDKAVFNGVGENDSTWQEAVEHLNEQLVFLGIDSVYVEFAGQPHTPSAGWTGKGELFQFWSDHGP